MTDIEARIAAILREQFGIFDPAVAAAVVTGLGLKQERRANPGWDVESRYVTPWESTP